MFQVLRPWRILVGAVALITTAVASASEPFSPAPAAAESFDVGTLHVDKFGTGEPALILIPGLACGPWVWYDTITKYAPARTLYVLTLPGFDGRAAPKEKPLFGIFARDFWALLAARKIDKPIIIGHSMGGTLAIALAEEHPERLSGIVTGDGLPVFPLLANASPAQRETIAKQMADRYASLSKDEQFTAEKAFMSTSGTNKPELVESSARRQTRSDPKAVAAWVQETLSTDLRPNLKKITIPFLEIMPYDPADAKTTPANTEDQTLAFYKSLIVDAPKSSVVAVAPSRHFVMLDQPEAFHKSIMQFLTSLHP